jgi:hypothetical protein
VRVLAPDGNSWHLVEFAIALGAGIVAGSVALESFGIDSLIEVLAEGAVVWLFSDGRGSSVLAGRRAQHLIAASFLLLAAFVAVESAGSSLAGITRERAGPVSLLLRRRRCRCSRRRSAGSGRVGSGVELAGNGVRGCAQNQLCAHLSIALHVGLLFTAVCGGFGGRTRSPRC